MERKYKHTPGKWIFSTLPQPNGCPIVGVNGLMVAMLAHSVNEPAQKEEAIANAQLIAAAPCLLEQLRDVLRSCRKDFPFNHQGEEEFQLAYSEPLAAIARATGETR